jgi:hypothetical protein
MYMKQDRARDKKDAAVVASAESVESMSGGLSPPLPGGDLKVVPGMDDVDPGVPDCPAVLQTRITMISMIWFQR